MIKEEAKKILEHVDLSEEFETDNRWTLYDLLIEMLENEKPNFSDYMEECCDYIEEYGIIKPYKQCYDWINRNLDYNEEADIPIVCNFNRDKLQLGLSGDTVVEILNIAYKKVKSLDENFIKDVVIYASRVPLDARNVNSLSVFVYYVKGCLGEVLRTLEAMITIATHYNDDDTQGEEKCTQ